MLSRSNLSMGFSDAKLACHRASEGFTHLYLGWLQLLEERLERGRVDGTIRISAVLIPVPLKKAVLFIEGSRRKCPGQILLFHLRRAEGSQKSLSPGSFA